MLSLTTAITILIKHAIALKIHMILNLFLEKILKNALILYS